MTKLNDHINAADKLADELHRTLKTMIESTKDYDIQRILKRSEAEVMDLRHNLSLVRRLEGD